MTKFSGHYTKQYIFLPGRSDLLNRMVDGLEKLLGSKQVDTETGKQECDLVTCFYLNHGFSSTVNFHGPLWVYLCSSRYVWMACFSFNPGYSAGS